MSTVHCSIDCDDFLVLTYVYSCIDYTVCSIYSKKNCQEHITQSKTVLQSHHVVKDILDQQQEFKGPTFSSTVHVHFRQVLMIGSTCL